MKNVFCVFIFILFQKSIAQDLVFSFSKKEYLSTIIKLENGNELHGYMKDFTLPNTVEFRGLAFNFKSIESKLKLDRTEFKFKKTLDSKIELLDSDNIQSITLIDKDTIIFEKIKLKTVNSNLEIIDLEREIMAPLVRKDKINFYAINVYKGDKLSGLSFVLNYIRKPEDQFALIPIDINRINLFNLGSVDDKYIRAFEEVGKDCPKFLEYLNYQKKLFDDKNYRKQFKEEKIQRYKELKEKLKTAKSSEEIREIQDNSKSYEFTRLIHNLINEYVKLCD